MEVYLKKYFWTLGIIVTVVCAMLAGRGVNHIVEAKYLTSGEDFQPPDPAGDSSKAADSAPQRSKSGKPLADRNIFCATCEPPEPEIEDPIETDPDRVPKTSLPLELVATNVSSNQALSFATIRNRDSNRQGAYWLEQSIPDAGEIVRITGRYVDFVNDSAKRVERISLLDDDGGRSPEPAQPRARPERRSERSSRSSGGDDMQAMIDEGIRETGDNEYEIKRDLVDQVLANPAQVARGARIVPSIRDGEANGFKLYAIRPSSVFAKVGLMNGDTINEINGFELTTPDKALEVYQRVRDANNLSVKVTRRGEPVTLRYSIR